MKENVLKYPLDIQLFAEGDGDGDKTPPTTNVSSQVEVDYDKLASIVNKKSSTTEDKVLQGYFKNQGLSPEEAAQAIQQFKSTREASAQVEFFIILNC